MILTRFRVSILAVLFAGSLACVAQNPPVNITLTPSDQSTGDAAKKQDSSSATVAPPPTVKQPDKSAAYYHFMMAHMYEEMVSMYGRSDYAN